MSQKEKLAAKEAEIKAELEKWALAEGILGPGETIEFSMEIKRVPVVSMVHSQDLQAVSCITYNSATSFDGVFVGYAQLTQEDIEIIVTRVREGKTRKKLFEFISKTNNPYLKKEPVRLSGQFVRSVNEAMKTSVNGRFYRLANVDMGRSKGYLLFEVRPST
jgi:hypothetical protein